MKKIAQVITQSELGGAQKHIILLAKEFKERGYEVDVIAGGSGDLKKILESDGINYIEDPYMVREISLGIDIKNVKYLKNLFKKNGYDIVHCHSSKAGLVGRIAARLAKIDKIIYTVHGFVFNEPMNKIKKYIYIICEFIGARCGDEIVTVSKKDYQCALDYNIGNANNTIFIPNAIKDIDKKSLKCREDMLSQLGIDNNTFIIGNVSNFYETKGHRYLIDALIKLYDEGYDFHVLFAGEGNNLQEMQEKSKNYDKIKFLGFRKDNYDIMNCFDLFVLPSVKEGMPYVILEAMNLGKPVLCTEVGALVDIIKDGENGYIVEPQSTEVLYKKIKSILENKELQDIGKAGEEYVKKHFSFESFVNNLEKLYDNREG